jgi:hypothetical protein
MSHTTTLKGLKFVDMVALQQAVDYLRDIEGIRNISLVQNSRPRMYYREQEVMCDYVVKLPGKYDVGFVKQSDGTYAPIFDEFQNYVREWIGAPPSVKEGGPVLHISRLADLYGVHAAKNQLAQDGYGYNSNIYYSEEDNSYCLEVAAAY